MRKRPIPAPVARAAHRAQIRAGGVPIVAFRNWYGHTPLQLAVDYGEMSAVKALLAAGADPNRPDRYGWHTLQLASDCDNVAAVVLRLLMAGADPLRHRDENGDTPLEAARKFGAPKIRDLVQAAADRQPAAARR